MAVSWPPCAAGDLPFLLLLPRGSQCPGEKSLTPLPGRDSVGQRSCLSVCPADYFPRDPASWQLPSPSGFSGSSVPIPIPLFCTKGEATSGRQGGPCPVLGRAEGLGFGVGMTHLGPWGVRAGARAEMSWQLL